MTQSDPPPNQTPKEWVFWVVEIAYAVAMAILAIVALTAWQEKFEFIGLEWTAGGLVIIAQVLHLILSIRTVSFIEHGLIIFYGMPVRLTTSGPKIIPLGLLQLVKLRRTVIQREFPAEPELVWKGTDTEYDNLSEEQKKRYVRPIRITTADIDTAADSNGMPDEQKRDPLLARMTLEAQFFARYQIEDPLSFFLQIGEIEEAERQIRDTAEAELTEQWGQHTPAWIIEHLNDVSKGLKERVIENTSTWGITILEVGVKTPDLSREVSASLRNVPVARLEARQVVIRAGGERIRLTEEGHGRAAAVLAELEARADGYQSIQAKGNLKDNRLVLWAETARTAMQTGKHTVIAGSGGLADLLAGGTALANALKIDDKRDDNTTPPPQDTTNRNPQT